MKSVFSTLVKSLPEAWRGNNCTHCHRLPLSSIRYLRLCVFTLVFSTIRPNTDYFLKKHNIRLSVWKPLPFTSAARSSYTAAFLCSFKMLCLFFWILKNFLLCPHILLHVMWLCVCASCDLQMRKKSVFQLQFWEICLFHIAWKITSCQHICNIWGLFPPYCHIFFLQFYSLICTISRLIEIHLVIFVKAGVRRGSGLAADFLRATERRVQ